jgi:hypothetical protein
MFFGVAVPLPTTFNPFAFNFNQADPQYGVSLGRGMINGK